MAVSSHSVLFVCIENACRSQMAQGFCAAMADNVGAESAGTNPAERVDGIAVQVMAELDIDISGQQPKDLSTVMNDQFDVIVMMGCIDGCPLTPRDKTIVWDIEDPHGKPIEVYRRIRDGIRKHVEGLLADIS